MLDHSAARRQTWVNAGRSASLGEDPEQGELELLTLPWTNTDLHALICGAIDLNAPPRSLALALYRESEMRPNATAFVDAEKKYIGIVGLNQFTQEAVIGNFYPSLVGKGAEAFKAWQDFAHKYRLMTPAEQMPYIVQSLKESAWFKTGKPFTETSLYMANFLPGKSTFTDPNTILLAKPDKPCSDPEARGSLYCQNKGMDIDTSDGGITLGDVAAFLQKIAKQPRFVAFESRIQKLLDNSVTSVICPGI
jgi:hypothetical protein